MLCYHCYHQQQYELSLSGSPKSSAQSSLYKWIDIVTISTMTLFTLDMTTSIIAYFVCSKYLITSPIYQLAKCSMYILVLIRLHFLYNKSIYAINKLSLQICGILVIIIYVSLSIWACFITRVYTFNYVIFGKSITSCHRSYETTYLTVSLCLDVIEAIIVLIVFPLPLIKIINSLNQNYPKESVQNNKDLKYPVIKFSILTIICCMTTLIAHIICIPFATDIVFAIDITLNCLCVMLMTPYHQILYQKLCCGLIRCFSLCDTIKNEEIVEIVTQKPVGDNYHVDIDDTQFDTMTLGITPDAIIYQDSDKEMTQTVQN